MGKYARFGTFFQAIGFYTFRRTTLPLEAVDRNIFGTEFYHLKVQNPIVCVFSRFYPQMRG